MQLSIVTSLYRSAPHLEEFVQRMTAAAKRLTADFEMIFVDDGSPDDSLAVMQRLQQQYDNIVLVELARNFGQSKALMTGLSYAKGDKVFLLDSDLEEDPELLLSFHDKMQATGCDVVYGVQEKRKGSWYERFSGALFYKTVNMLCDVKIPKNNCTIRYMTKQYVQSLLDHKEREVNIVGVMVLTGYHQESHVVEKRETSVSNYTFAKHMGVLVNNITAFSEKPLKLIFLLGTLITTLSVFFILYILSQKWFFGNPISGWTALMVSIWFFSGVIIFVLGVLGLYLSKMFIEVKDRPYTIVKSVYRGN